MTTLREKIIAKWIVNIKEIRWIEDFFENIWKKKLKDIEKQKKEAQKKQAEYQKWRKIMIARWIPVLILFAFLYSIIDFFPGWLFLIILFLALLRFLLWNKKGTKINIQGVPKSESFDVNKILWDLSYAIQEKIMSMVPRIDGLQKAWYIFEDRKISYRVWLQNISKSMLSDFIKIFWNFSYSVRLKISDMIPKIENLRSLWCIPHDMDWETEDYIHWNLERQWRNIEIEGFEIKMNSLDKNWWEQSYVLIATFLENRYTVQHPVTITNHYYTVPNTPLFGHKKQKVPIDGMFPKDFQITCEDSTEAYTVITHSLSEKLIKLTEKNPDKAYMFCFFENKIYIKQIFQWKFFDVLSHENITSHPEDFFDFYIQFREILELFYDLNLFYYSKISLKK